MKSNKKVGSILSFFLFLSVIFFVISLAVAGFLFFGGSNVVSSKNIDISFGGPVSVQGGEEFDLLINVINKNSSDLRYANLIVEYPEGARSTIGEEEHRYRKYIGDIKAGQVINETVKAMAFGEEGSERQIKITIEYRAENSNAIFVKEATYKTVISSSPLSVEMKLPDRVNNNQEIEMTVTVSANTSAALNGVVLEADYPSGFIFKEAAPTPSYGDNLWRLGDLSAKKSRQIKIKGIVKGQNEEEKAFRVSAGIQSSKDSNKVDVVYNSSSKSLFLSKPSVALNIVLNGVDQESNIVKGGDLVRVDIGWMNNLPTKIVNSEIVAKLSGEALNRQSISSISGFYRSVDNSIVWNKSVNALPDAIEPGESGHLSFSFSISSLSSRLADNPEIDLDVFFKGSRSLEGGGGELVDLSSTKKIKISSNLQLAARAVYYAGPFKNSGSLPPVREKQTSYTIIWSIVNSSNDVSDVVVKASLPSYVRWLGQISPASESISYNPLGGEIVWNVGDVNARSGVTNPAREVAFQIGFVPSISQIGDKPMLTSDATIKGTDGFTNEQLSTIRRALNIEIVSDPGVSPEENGPVK